MVSTRLIIFTGKGGVGKTTCAAATAYRTSELGKKTLVMSSDPAQALSESMNTKLGIKEPKELKKNLYGLEIDIQTEVNNQYGNIRDYMIKLFESRGIDVQAASEMAAIPGTDELFSILKLQDYIEDYDVIVLDTAPTGHTFRLLAMPQIFSVYGKTFTKIGSGIAKLFQQTGIGGAMEQATSTPLPTAEFFEQLREIDRKIKSMYDILNEAKTTCRIVTNLEKMPIQESERALTFMSLYGLLVDGIVVNKVLPGVLDPSYESDMGKYFDKWMDSQKEYMKRIENSFHPLKVMKSRLMEEEVIGFELLKRIADDMYGKKGDPTEIYTKKQALEFVVDEYGNLTLELEIPFAREGKTTLKKQGEELIITIGENKRIILLPNYAMNMKIKKAAFEAKKLTIIMSNPEEENGYSVPID
ncbi:MAG: ArsA family ATPase [Candidatus Lokiarchaeota archaeon]|nr:ArsA family ATPase [Candidatus Lokiarchaeota archaeon]